MMLSPRFIQNQQQSAGFIGLRSSGQTVSSSVNVRNSTQSRSKFQRSHARNMQMLDEIKRNLPIKFQKNNYSSNVVINDFIAADKEQQHPKRQTLQDLLIEDQKTKQQMMTERSPRAQTAQNRRRNMMQKRSWQQRNVVTRQTISNLPGVQAYQEFFNQQTAADIALAPTLAETSYNKLQMKNLETSPMSVFSPIKNTTTSTAGSLALKTQRCSEPKNTKNVEKVLTVPVSSLEPV